MKICVLNGKKKHAGESSPPTMVDAEAEASIEALEGFCGSDELSFDAVRVKVRSILRRWPDFTLPTGSSLLHWVCGNENVTLEIAECILEAFPAAANSIAEATYRYDDNPIHLACLNENCSGSVIDLLVKKCPDSLQSYALGRLSLHSYLTR